MCTITVLTFFDVCQFPSSIVQTCRALIVSQVHVSREDRVVRQARWHEGTLFCVCRGDRADGRRHAEARHRHPERRERHGAAGSVPVPTEPLRASSACRHCHRFSFSTWNVAMWRPSGLSIQIPNTRKFTHSPRGPTVSPAPEVTPRGAVTCHAVLHTTEHWPAGLFYRETYVSFPRAWLGSVFCHVGAPVNCFSGCHPVFAVRSGPRPAREQARLTAVLVVILRGLPRREIGHFPARLGTVFCLEDVLDWDFHNFSQPWQRMLSLHPEGQSRSIQVTVRLSQPVGCTPQGTPFTWLHCSPKLRKNAYAKWKTGTKHNLCSRLCYSKAKIYYFYILASVWEQFMNTELITFLEWVCVRQGKEGRTNENLTVPDLPPLWPQAAGSRGSRTEAQTCS